MVRLFLGADLCGGAAIPVFILMVVIFAFNSCLGCATGRIGAIGVKYKDVQIEICTE